MNFVMNHAPGAGLIAQPVDQQSSALPLCYGCPQTCQLQTLQTQQYNPGGLGTEVHHNSIQVAQKQINQFMSKAANLE